MNTQAMIERYGRTWTTDPPAEAMPFVMEGARRIDELTANRRSFILTKITKDTNTARVIQRINTLAYDVVVNTNDKTTLHPADLAGQLAYQIDLAGRQGMIQNTIYPNNDGFNGAAEDGRYIAQEGLSFISEEVNLRYSPLVVPPGQSASLVLIVLDPSLGLPVPQGEERYFWGRLTGFSLVCP